jgi:AsmA protein
MRKLAYVLLAIVALVIGAAVLAPVLIPTDAIKERVAREVERATGRAFAIEGPVSVSLLPALAVEAEHVRLANPKGASEPDMARLGAFEIELQVLPLLSGSVEVARFVLVEPEIHLEIDQQGNPNWQFTPAGGSAAPAETPPPADGVATDEGGGDGGSGGGDGGGLPISDLKLGVVRLVNGRVTYTDHRSGQTERIEALNASVELEDARSPLAVDGSFRYQGREVLLDLDVANPLALAQNGSSALQASVVSNGVVALGFSGEASNGGVPGANGSLDLAVESIRDLAAWLAEPLAFHGDGLQTLEIAGRVEADPSRVAFDEVTIAFDEIDANGSFEAVLGGSVPKLVGRLDVGPVDLTPYLPEPQEPAATDGDPRPQAAQERPRQADQGRPAGWSREPLALPPIGGVDLRFALSVEALRARELQLDRTALDLEMRGNTLLANLTEFRLYGGEGKGSLRLTASEAGLELQKQFTLEGLQARPFLTDAMDFDLIEGTARAELMFETQGRSEFDLVSNLDGQGEVRFADGAVIGYNLAQMVRQVATAGFARDERRKTDFAELGGTFTVEDGILRNDDLRMVAPLLRVNGAGRVNLKGRRINYRLEPKAAPTLQGQGGRETADGILVPIDIKGTWEDPQIVPDVRTALQSVIQNKEQLGEAAKQIERQLKDPKGAQQLLESLGRSAADPDQASDDPAGAAAQQLLKGLFGN